MITAAATAGSGLLVITTPMRAAKISPSRVLLSKKFVAGVTTTADLWGGPVRCVLALRSAERQMEDAEYDVRDLPFEVMIADFESPAFRSALRDAAVVSGGEHHLLRWVSRYCRKREIAFVPVLENPLPNRIRMLALDHSPLLARLRKIAWALFDGIKDYPFIWSSTAIQCNGIPAYDHYRWVSRDRLLFFDGRVSESMLPSEEQVRKRLEHVRSGKPLRLAFSGRFTAIKGADHLPLVAARLRETGTPFELHLFGAGELEPLMKETARRLGVASHIAWHGAVDFTAELVPALRESVDLFVACHRQADPSCTYLETLSCGVPIAGYGNQAFSGMLRLSRGGWSVPRDRVDALAQLIAEIARCPEDLERASLDALAFARQNTYESTWRRRTEHYRRAAAGVHRNRNISTG